MQLPGARDCHGRLLVHVFVRKMDTAAFTADETTRAVHFMVEAALRACPSAQARGRAAQGLVLWSPLLPKFSERLIRQGR